MASTNIAPYSVGEGQSAAERIATLELQQSIQQLIDAEDKRQKDELTHERQDLLNRYGDKMRELNTIQSAYAEVKGQLQEAVRRETELRTANQSAEVKAEAATRCVEALQKQVDSSQNQIVAVQKASLIAQQLAVTDVQGANAEHLALLDAAKKRCNDLEASPLASQVSTT